MFKVLTAAYFHLQYMQDDFHQHTEYVFGTRKQMRVKNLPG